MTDRATYDRMTGLVNRREFEDLLSRLLVRLRDEASAHVVLLVDLDRFELINDACGRAAGDVLLRYVGASLQRQVRTHDIVARLGGDQFGVVLEHCPMDHAHRVAKAIFDRLAEFGLENGGQRLGVTASVGLVEVDKRWSDVAAVLRAADSACRVAKDTGGGRLHVWREADAADGSRPGDAHWVSCLETALEHEGFELFGQRIEQLNGLSQGLSVEVLLRMRDADGTYVAPGVFLPAAERHRLASRIDRWVLAHTLDWMESLGDAAAEIEQVAINLSGQSIGDTKAHPFILEMVRSSRIDPYKLCFEFSEKAAVTDLAASRLFIDQARPLGVRIAVDDFGVGRFSLGYLRSVPVDTLKIDRQLLPGLVNDPLADATVRYICEVAKAIGATTVAEGVDSEDVRHVLRDIGVDMAQGYLIHRPEPLDDVF